MTCPDSHADFVLRAVNSHEELLAALRMFCATIDATGGVVMLEDGNVAPAADEDWIDLGAAYDAARDAIAKATGNQS